MKDQFKWRNILRCLLAAGMFLAGCRPGKVRSGIAGTYVSAGASEFSIVHDTLVLEQSEGNYYVIHRRSGYAVLVKGRPGREKSGREEWAAVYDEQRQVLTETRMGKVIRPFPDGSKIWVGRRMYNRLK
jgi:hypothetical protein